MKVKIKIMTNDNKEDLIIEGTLITHRNKLVGVKEHLSQHDIAARLFAIEFAANAQEQCHMRCHIETDDSE